MEQTLTFENTIKVLEEFAEEVVESYKNKLVAHDHYASGKLWESVMALPIKVEGSRITVELQMNWYWKIIEEGLRPDGKYKNPGSFKGVFRGIMNWLTVKPTLPSHDYSGKLPNGHTLSNDDKTRTKQLAAMISKSILKHGTKGTHLLADTVQETRANLEAKVVEALNKDISNGLNIAMGYFTGGVK